MNTNLVKTTGGDALAMANVTEDVQNSITCVHDSQLPGTSRVSPPPSDHVLEDSLTRVPEGHWSNVESEKEGLGKR